jgi:predicted AlkP superfamily phosphohydrolase/phosphomutase
MPRRSGPCALLALALLLGCRDRPTGDRVLLVGIDAATWDVIRPMMAEGKLPTLSWLVRTGWSATLESIEPTISPAIWTTIATGQRPAVHGITGFLAPGPDGREIPVTSNVRRREPLWAIASRHERSVNVVGWYVTWPVEPVKGVMVSDRFVDADRGELVGGGSQSLSREHPGVYPAELTPDLEKLFVRADRFIDPYEREFHRQFKAYPVDATRTAIAERLMRERPADLTLVYLWGVDPIQHHFWKYHQPETWLGPPLPPAEVELNRNKVRDYYADTDAFLGRLVADAGPRVTVVVVSDHGAGPLLTYDPTNPVSGDHRLDGIVVIAGNHARHAAGNRKASILDITPTVLYLLGLPVGRDMEGRVLEDAIDPGFLAANPPRAIATHEVRAHDAQEKPQAAVPTDADERIKERLKSLGYLR